MRIVFMGSSDASATCLRAILRIPALKVVGVVTQPDRPAGRNQRRTPCKCAAYALERGIAEIITPENVNAPEAMEQIRAWKPDVVVVVAFGQFLKQPLLDLPPHGCINGHFSLLPKYRGASPVAAMIAAGEKMSGVSIIRMGIGMDDGDILMRAYEPICLDDTATTLMDRLAILGGVTLAKTLKLLNAATLPAAEPQIQEEATFAHKMKKTDGLIDWSLPSAVIERRVRAYDPWPGAYTFLPQHLRRTTGRVKVLTSEFVREPDPAWKAFPPATLCAHAKHGPIVRTGDTYLLLTTLQPDGGRAMDGGDFIRGRRMAIGETFLME